MPRLVGSMLSGLVGSVLLALLGGCGAPVPEPHQSAPVRCPHPEAGLRLGMGLQRPVDFADLYGFSGGFLSLPEPWPAANLCFAADQEFLYWVYSTNDFPRRCLVLSATHLYWIDDRSAVIYGMPKQGGAPVALARGAPTELAVEGAELYWGTNRPGTVWKPMRPPKPTSFVQPRPTSQEHLGTVLRVRLGGGPAQVLAKPPLAPALPETMHDVPGPALRRVVLSHGRPETLWAPADGGVMGGLTLDGRSVFTTDGRRVLRISRENGRAQVIKQLLPHRAVSSLCAHDQVLYWAELELNEPTRYHTLDSGSGLWVLPEATGRPALRLQGVAIAQLLSRGCDLYLEVEYGGGFRLPTWSPWW